ncbi:MAG: hypothetical protein H0U49_03105 [Parachlamydiaceae bacterium]|nr:hypothetical protein [Parachlamydiaceae bacterium]
MGGQNGNVSLLFKGLICYNIIIIYNRYYNFKIDAKDLEVHMLFPKGVSSGPFVSAYSKSKSQPTLRTSKFEVEKKSEISKIVQICKIYLKMQSQIMFFVPSREMLPDSLKSHHMFHDFNKLESEIKNDSDQIVEAVHLAKKDADFLSDEDLLKLAESQGHGKEYKELLDKCDCLTTRKEVSEWLHDFFRLTGREPAKTAGGGLITAVDLSVGLEDLHLLSTRPAEALALTVCILHDMNVLGLLLEKSPRAHHNLQIVETLAHRLIHDLAELQSMGAFKGQKIETYDLTATTLASLTLEQRTLLAIIASKKISASGTTLFQQIIENVTKSLEAEKKTVMAFSEFIHQKQGTASPQYEINQAIRSHQKNRNVVGGE